VARGSELSVAKGGWGGSQNRKIRRNRPLRERRKGVYKRRRGKGEGGGVPRKKKVPKNTDRKQFVYQAEKGEMKGKGDREGCCGFPCGVRRRW